ncbi:tyrosine-type recombinase/integrase [Gemmata sp.]|uniref:tyrosine-type recombinase/integrase n=1 Tax=Gemmata sp. TaxID=1914242 RepID=UPI003F70A3AD
MPNPPKLYTHAGESLTLKQWSQRTGLHVETIRSRIEHQGYTLAEALTAPLAKKFRPKRKGATGPKPCPAYKQHAGGQAFARWWANGREHARYFGPWQSPESRDAYKRFAIEWASGADLAPAPAGGLNVGELVVRYMRHAERYYVKEGKQTSEVAGQRAALNLLNEHYGDVPVGEVKGRHLKALQQAMIDAPLARDTINKYTWRVCRCFRWGVGEDLVPPDVAAVLESVPNLQPGRTAAEDADPVMSVPLADIEATLPHLHELPERRAVLAQMVRAMLLIGCRPGELCAMTWEKVDRTNPKVWCYRIGSDKNLHRKARRKPKLVWIGPRGQEVLRPFLPAGPDPRGRVWVFPPRGEKGTKRTAVSRESFGEYVRLACERAGVEPWTPHQLRHNRATEVQRLYEDNAAAAAIIGDTPQVAAEVYADPNEAVARRIAIATG